MASIFEAVREAVPVPLAAERYGLMANRAGMVLLSLSRRSHPKPEAKRRLLLLLRLRGRR